MSETWWGIFFRKWPKTRIFTYFGVQSGPKIGPLRPIFQYLQWACEAIMMWNQWKLFEKVTKVQNFDILWGPKWPKNWAFEAHIVHISESCSNDHKKARLMWIQGKLFNKIVENLNIFWLIWRSKMAKKFGPLGPIFYTPTKVAKTSKIVIFYVFCN